MTLNRIKGSATLTDTLDEGDELSFLSARVLEEGEVMPRENLL